MKILDYLVSKEYVELMLDIAEGTCSRVCLYTAETNWEVKILNNCIYSDEELRVCSLLNVRRVQCLNYQNADIEQYYFTLLKACVECLNALLLSVLNMNSHTL